ncbi:Protein FAR1-RELATED SEQUENCE 5 [Bienertia sinuspersici]
MIHHSLAHNHPLTRQQWNHLHRYERTMTREKGGLIETMQESGLRPMESYRYMITKQGVGDAQAVIDKLYQNMSGDLKFFFRVRVDGYGRVSSIFWRDSMMKKDYNIYGDVTISDTTYRTNRFGALKKDASFKGAFQKVYRGVHLRKNLRKTWHQMIMKYNLEKSKWFSRLYALKEKWATALSKDFFQLVYCLHNEVKAPIMP